MAPPFVCSGTDDHQARQPAPHLLSSGSPVWYACSAQPHAPPPTHRTRCAPSQVVFLPSIVIVPMLGSCSRRVADDGALLPPLQGLWSVGAPAGVRGAFRAHPRPIWLLCDASTVGLGAAGWLLRLRSTVRGGLGEFDAAQLARSHAAALVSRGGWARTVRSGPVGPVGPACCSSRALPCVRARTLKRVYRTCVVECVLIYSMVLNRWVRYGSERLVCELRQV